MPLKGLSLIAGDSGLPSERAFRGVSPTDNGHLEPLFYEARENEVVAAITAANAAFRHYGRTPSAFRATFLRRVADEIASIRDEIADRFVAETGLGIARAHSELERTCGQFRLFAELLENENWMDLRHDVAMPDRKPSPRPDLRSRLRPIGPVAVFGPANFPLAFGVVGGDVASALAAGCPVLAKAHSSHPGTCELAGAALNKAAREMRLPSGVFSMLFGGIAVGVSLVEHPMVKGVGFTGSRAGGAALFRKCVSRNEPIPFFGELSSLNPVFLLPRALSVRAESIADGLAASMILGCGQFCTKPGLVVHLGAASDVARFTGRLIERLRTTAPAVMLSEGTRRQFATGVARIAATPGVRTLVGAFDQHDETRATAALFACDARSFIEEPNLQEEVFGPCTILVSVDSLDEMLEIANALEGQLTLTVHQEGADLDEAESLLFVAETKAGRIVFDGWPTGVEVSTAIVHGGPWPASTDCRFTSVGTAAIRRWLRPVCWQNAPSNALAQSSRFAI